MAHEIPLRLLRQPMLVRAVDGPPVLWLRRSTRPLDAQVDVDLRLDTLECSDAGQEG